MHLKLLRVFNLDIYFESPDKIKHEYIFKSKNMEIVYLNSLKLKTLVSFTFDTWYQKKKGKEISHKATD